jgi:hypothetical protein
MRAVGLLRTDLQTDFEIDSTLGEILDRDGAGGYNNRRTPCS